MWDRCAASNDVTWYRDMRMICPPAALASGKYLLLVVCGVDLVSLISGCGKARTSFGCLPLWWSLVLVWKEATKVPRNIMCKVAALTLIQGFTDMCLSCFFFTYSRQNRQDHPLCCHQCWPFLCQNDGNSLEFLERLSLSTFFHVLSFPSCQFSSFHLLTQWLQ